MWAVLATLAVIFGVYVESSQASLYEEADVGLEDVEQLRSWGRRLSSSSVPRFHAAIGTIELPLESDSNATIPDASSEGELVTIRVWASEPAAVDDIEVALSLNVVAAGSDADLGSIVVVPSVRFIEAFTTNAEATDAVANGNWSNVDGDLGANAGFVEFSATMPDDLVPSGSSHLLELVVNGNGSSNGTFDGLESRFRFYLEEDDSATIALSSSLSTAGASFSGQIEVSAYLGAAPSSNVTLNITSEAAAGSDQTEPPFVVANGSPSVTGVSELAVSGATFSLQINENFNFIQQAELEGTGNVEVLVAVGSTSAQGAFDGLEAAVSVTIVVETVTISARAFGSDAFSTDNSSHVVLQEGSSSSEHFEVYVTGTVTDTVMVQLKTNNTNPVYDVVPPVDRYNPYAGGQGIPPAFDVTPSTLFFVPGGTTSRVVQVRGRQNAVADGLRTGSIQLVLNSTFASTSSYELENGTITVAVLDDDVPGLALSAVQANSTNSSMGHFPTAQVELQEGSAAILRVGTLTSPFATVGVHVTVALDQADSDGVEVFLHNTSDVALGGTSQSLNLTLPAGIDAMLDQDTSFQFIVRLSESITQHDGHARTATVVLRTNSSDPKYDGLLQNVTVNIIEKSSVGDVGVIVTQNTSVAATEGDRDVVVGTVRLSSIPDAPMYGNGTVRVFVAELAQYELSDVGLSLANQSNDASIANRTIEPAISSAYPFQLETDSEGYVAVLEFNEANWEQEQDVVVSVLDDSIIEIEQLSVVLGFVAESPDMTNGYSSMPDATTGRAVLRGDADAMNETRIEAAADAAMDIIVVDNEQPFIQLWVEGGDNRGVAGLDAAFTLTNPLYSSGLDLYNAPRSVAVCGNDTISPSSEASGLGIFGSCAVLRENELAWLVVALQGGETVFPVDVTVSVEGLGGEESLVRLGQATTSLMAAAQEQAIPLLSSEDLVASELSVVFSELSLNASMPAEAGPNPVLNSTLWGATIVGTLDDDVPYVEVALEGASPADTVQLVSIPTDMVDMDQHEVSGGAVLRITESGLANGLGYVVADMIRFVNGGIQISVETLDEDGLTYIATSLATSSDTSLSNQTHLDSAFVALSSTDDNTINQAVRNFTVRVTTKVFENATVQSGEMPRLELLFIGTVSILDDDTGSVQVVGPGVPSKISLNDTATSSFTTLLDGESSEELVAVVSAHAVWPETFGLPSVSLAAIDWSPVGFMSLPAWAQDRVTALNDSGLLPGDVLYATRTSLAAAESLHTRINVEIDHDYERSFDVQAMSWVFGAPYTNGWSEEPANATIQFLEVNRTRPQVRLAVGDRPTELSEGDSPGIVAKVRLDNPPDSFIYANGSARVLVTELTTYRLNSLGRSEAAGSGTSSLAERTNEPALGDSYPAQFEPVMNGHIAVIEFNESNWDQEVDVRLSPLQDDAIEIDLVSTVLGFFSESPEMTHGDEAMPNATTLVAMIEAYAVDDGHSRMEAVVSDLVDVLVRDDDLGTVEVQTTGTPSVIEGYNASSGMTATINGTSSETIVLVFVASGTFHYDGATIPGLELLPIGWNESYYSDLPSWAQSNADIALWSSFSDGDAKFVVVENPTTGDSFDMDVEAAATLPRTGNGTVTLSAITFTQEGLIGWNTSRQSVELLFVDVDEGLYLDASPDQGALIEGEEEAISGQVFIAEMSATETEAESYTVNVTLSVVSGAHAGLDDIVVVLKDNTESSLAVLGGESGSYSTVYNLVGPLLFEATAPADSEAFEHKATFALTVTITGSTFLPVDTITGTDAAVTQVTFFVYEAPDLVVMNPQTFQAAEGGANASVHVRLAAIPDVPDNTGTSEVVVFTSQSVNEAGLLVTDPSELEYQQLVFEPASLTFDQSNWNVTQTIMVSALDDSFVEPDTLYAYLMLTVDQNASASNYHGVEYASATVQLEDNDVSEYRWAASSLSVRENEGSAQVVLFPTKLPLFGKATLYFDASATGSHPSYAIEYVTEGYPEPGLELAKLTDHTVPVDHAFPNVTLNLNFKGLDFVLQGDEQYVISVTSESDTLAGLDHAGGNDTVPDTMALELVDTTNASMQLVYVNDGVEVVLSDSDEARQILESAGPVSYFARLSAVPPPHGNISISVAFQRANTTVVEGMAPLPQLSSGTMVAVGADLSEPSEGFVHQLSFGVDIEDDDTHFGEQVDFLLKLSASDTYGGGLSDYEFPFAHGIEAVYSTAVGIVVSPTQLQVAEGAPAAQFSVRASTSPLYPVTISASSPFNGTQVVIQSPASVVIDQSNWDTPQQMSVLAIRDGAGAPDEPAMESAIELTPSSADPFYSELGAVELPITVTDEVGIELEAVTPGSYGLGDGRAIVTNLTEGASPTGIPPVSSGFTYRIRLTAPPTAGSVTVQAAEETTSPRPFSGGTTALLAVSPAEPMEFTSSNFNEWREIVVTVLDDNVDEGVSASTAVLHSVSAPEDPRYDGRFVPRVIFGITDNDEAGIRVQHEHDAVEVVEGDAEGGVFTVSLGTRPSGTVTITVQSDSVDEGVGGSGGLGVDYGVTSSLSSANLSDVGAFGNTSIVFDADTWNIPQSIHLFAGRDGLTETEEGFSLTVSSADSDDAVYAATDDVSVDVLVYDPVGIGVVDDSSFSVLEGGASASGGGARLLTAAVTSSTHEYSVQLLSPPARDSTVSVRPSFTSDTPVGPIGSAYLEAVPETVQFTRANWKEPVVIRLEAVQNTFAEGDVSVTVGHTSQSASDSRYSGLVGGESAQISGQVIDDDAPGFILRRIDQAPSAGLPLLGTSNAVAVGPDALLTPTWSVAGSEGLVVEMREGERRSIEVTLASTPFQAVSADLEHSSHSNGLVQIISPSRGTLDFGGSGNTARGAAEFTRAGWDFPVRLDVFAPPDFIDRGDTYTQTLSVNAGMGSPDEYVNVSMPITVIVHDDDAASVRVVQPDDFYLEEGESGQFFVRLGTTPSGTVTLSLAASGLSIAGDAPFGGAVIVTPSSLSFTTANWQTPQSVSIVPTDDQAVFRGATPEQLRSVQVNVTVASAPSDPAYAGLVGGSAEMPAVTARVTEDDVPGISVDQSYLLLGEGGVGGAPSSGTVSMSFKSAPVGSVTVTAAASNGQIALTPAAAVRTASNWQTPVVFTITAVDDETIESGQSATVTLGLSSTDPDYSSPVQLVGGEQRGIEASLLEVSVEILDNDVEAAIDTTPAPVLSSAFLVETAREIEVVFDRATTMAGRSMGAAGSQACSSMQVLDPATLLSVGGSSAVCYWPARDRLRIAVGQNGGMFMEPAAGSTVYIRRGVIKASASSIFSSSGSVVLQGRLPIPAVRSVRFSSSGASLDVEFTSKTSQLLADGPGAGPCSRVFENWQILGASQTGPAASSCTFYSATRMAVRLGIGATATPLLLFDALAPCANTTHGLVLRGNGAIRAVQGSVNSASRSCSLIAGPVVPASPPRASISGPERISFCDGIQLDGSSTTGGGGRPLAFSWSVTIGTIAGATAAQRDAAEERLQAALVASQTSRSALGLRPGIVSIANATLLPAGSTITFEMRASSFLSVEPGVASHTVVVEDQPIPLISIQGTRSLYIRASQSVRLSVDASLPTCDGGGGTGPREALQYRWTAVSASPWLQVASAALSVPALPDLAQYFTRGGRTLVLPPRLVVSGGRYVVQAEAFLPSRPSVRNTATMELLVVGQGVRAEIAGGATREIGQSQTLRFDATSSSDRDGFTLAQVGAQSFSWSCVQLPDTVEEEAAILAGQFAVVGGVVVDQGSGSLFPACTDTTGRQIDFNVPTDPAHGPQSSPGTGLPTLGPRNLGQGRYRISVTYSRGTNSTAGALLPLAVRSSTASIDLSVVSGSPPIVTSAGVVGNPDKILSNVRSSLRATVTLGSGLPASPGDLSYSWRIDTTNQQIASRVFATPSDRLQVTLRPGVLEPGSAYTFVFTVTDTVTGGSSTATTEVLVNQPPFSGYLAAQPRAGTMLETQFSLQAVQWTDDEEDLPLRYLFGYYLAEGSAVQRAADGQLQAGEEAPEFIPMSNQFAAQDSVSGVRLPRGVGSSNQLTLAVKVSDRLGATTTAYFDETGAAVVLQVDPPTVESTDDILNLVESTEAGLDEAELEGDISRILNDISAITDVLDIVPGDPCDGVTCSDGERCFQGNCVSEVETEEDDAGGAVVELPVVLACPGSSPSRVRQTDLVTGREMLVPADECSGNGICIRTPPMCSADDTTGCQAVCSCESGNQPNNPWAGAACARRQSAVNALQAQRQRLLQRQFYASNDLEGTEEDISMHAATLTGLSRDRDSLDESGQDLALAMAERLSNAALTQVESRDSGDDGEEGQAPSGVSLGTAEQILSVLGVLFSSNQDRYAAASGQNRSQAVRRLEAAATLLHVAGASDARRLVAEEYQSARAATQRVSAPQSADLGSAADLASVEDATLPEDASWNPLWWLGKGHAAALSAMGQHDAASELRGVLPDAMIGHQTARGADVDRSFELPYLGKIKLPSFSRQLSWLRVESSAQFAGHSTESAAESSATGSHRMLLESAGPLDVSILSDLIPMDLAREAADPTHLMHSPASRGRRLDLFREIRVGDGSPSSHAGQLKIAAHRLLQAAADQGSGTPYALINETRALSYTLRLRASAESLSRSSTLAVAQGEEPQTLQSDALQATSVRISIQEAQVLQLGSGAEMVLPLGGVSGLLNNNSVTGDGDASVDLRGIAWSSNPYLWSDVLQESGQGDAPERGGGVVSMDIAGAPASAGGTGSGDTIDVQELRCPLLLRLPVSDAATEDMYECRYFDEETGRDFTDGMVLLRFETDVLPNGNTRRMAICATLHLTDFSSQVEEDLPQINAIDPIGNAGLLQNYLDPRNFFVLIVLCVLFGAFVMAAGVSFCLYRATEQERKDLARAQFVRYGELRQGRGLDRLHKDDTGEVDPDVQRLREARKSGTAFLVVQHIWLTWLDRLRRHHGWGSVFSPPLDEQLRMTVAQRIGVLCATCLASMAVNAVFFGTTPSRVSGRVLVALISTLVMLPVNEFFPYLFTTVNSIQSRTLEERRQAILRRRERLKQLQAHAERIRQLNKSSQSSGGKVAGATAGDMLDDGGSLKTPTRGRETSGPTSSSRAAGRTGSLPPPGSAAKYTATGAGVSDGEAQEASWLATSDAADSQPNGPSHRSISADVGSGGKRVRKRLNIRVTSVRARHQSSPGVSGPSSTKAGERSLPPPPMRIGTDEDDAESKPSPDPFAPATGAYTPVHRVQMEDGAGPDPSATTPKSRTSPPSAKQGTTLESLADVASADVIKALGLNDASGVALLCEVARAASAEGSDAGAAGSGSPRAPAVIRAIESGVAKAVSHIRYRTRSMTTTKRRASLGGAGGAAAAPGRFQSKSVKAGAATAKLTHAQLFKPPVVNGGTGWMDGLPEPFEDPIRLLVSCIREEMSGGHSMSGESFNSAPGMVDEETDLDEKYREQGVRVIANAVHSGREALLDCANDAIKEFQQKTEEIGSSSGGSGEDVGFDAGEAGVLDSPRDDDAKANYDAKPVFRAPLSLLKAKSKRRMGQGDAKDITKSSPANMQAPTLQQSGPTAAKGEANDVLTDPDAAVGLLQSPTTAEQGGVAFPAADAPKGSSSAVASGVAALAEEDHDLRETLKEIEQHHAMRQDSRGFSRGAFSRRGMSDADSVVSDASGFVEGPRSKSGASSRRFGSSSSRSMGSRKRTRRRTVMLGSILDARPLTACEHTTLSAFTVLNLVQVWAAFIGFLFCIYLVAGEAYNYAGPLRTIVIGVSASFLFGFTGLMGYFQARQHSFVGTILFWIASILLQAGAAVSMVLLDAAFLREIAIMVFGLQLVPGLVALAAYVAYVVVQWRISSRMEELATQVQSMGQDEKQLGAVVMVQSAYRRFHAVQERVRLKELNVWYSDEVTFQRIVVAWFVYACLFLVVSLSFYIVLLYGVLFTPQQARAWILASFISFLTDIFIQEPVIQLALSIFDFIKSLADSSARSIVLASLASRAGLTAADIAAGLKQADMYRSRRSIHGSVKGGASVSRRSMSGGKKTMRPSMVTFADLLVDATPEERRREAAEEEASRAAEDGVGFDEVKNEEIEYEEEIDEQVTERDTDTPTPEYGGAAAAAGGAASGQ